MLLAVDTRIAERRRTPLNFNVSIITNGCSYVKKVLRDLFCRRNEPRIPLTHVLYKHRNLAKPLQKPCPNLAGTLPMFLTDAGGFLPDFGSKPDRTLARISRFPPASKRAQRLRSDGVRNRDRHQNDEGTRVWRTSKKRRSTPYPPAFPEQRRQARQYL